MDELMMRLSVKVCVTKQGKEKGQAKTNFSGHVCEKTAQSRQVECRKSWKMGMSLMRWQSI